MSTQKDKGKLGQWLDSPTRWTIEIYVWSILTPIIVALCVFFPHIWVPISVVYVAIVSNYALVLTAAGARQASLARIASSQDNELAPSDLKKIVDALIKYTTIEKAD